MTDSRVNLRNPALAAVLAWLIPGAGHFYQRRYFKAAVYFICVLGIFFWGCSMGEAKVVQLRLDQTSRPDRAKQKTLGFLAQAGVGITAVPAIAQTWRFNRQDAQQDQRLPPGSLIEEFDTTFTGRMQHDKLGYFDVTGHLVGTLRAGEYSGTEFEGRFTGQTSKGEAVDLKLLGSSGNLSLKVGDRVAGLDNVSYVELPDATPSREYSGSLRRFYIHVYEEDGSTHLGKLEGTVPRSFVNHFLAPLDDEAQNHLSRKLGKFFELALVYTWIAGLLNLLAVWDAYQGPAYGYGDETPESGEGKSPSDSSAAAANAAPATVNVPEPGGAT